MGAALLCVESSAATVGQQIHTHNSTDNYDLHHISRSHTTFQVSTLNCMIPNDIYRSHTTYQGSSLRFMIPHNVSGSCPAFQVSTLQFVIPYQVPHQGYNLPFVIPHNVSGFHATFQGLTLRLGSYTMFLGLKQHFNVPAYVL